MSGRTFLVMVMSVAVLGLWACEKKEEAEAPAAEAQQEQVMEAAPAETTEVAPAETTEVETTGMEEESGAMEAQ